MKPTAQNRTVYTSHHLMGNIIFYQNTGIRKLRDQKGKDLDSKFFEQMTALLEESLLKAQKVRVQLEHLLDNENSDGKN